MLTLELGISFPGNEKKEGKHAFPLETMGDLGYQMVAVLMQAQ